MSSRVSNLGLGMKRSIKAIAATAGYVLTLILLYWIDITYLQVDVVFYASLQVAALATLLVGLVLLLAPVFADFRAFEKVQLIIIWGLLGYITAISVPTVLDRSLSFYILEKLQQRGGGIQLDKFNYIFTTEYMREHRLVDIRLTEQQASGTIVIDKGCVKLTARGDRLASFGQFFRKSWLPKKRLLNGEYTDMLTDPFRRSDANPDYLCR